MNQALTTLVPECFQNIADDAYYLPCRSLIFEPFNKNPRGPEESQRLKSYAGMSMQRMNSVYKPCSYDPEEPSCTSDPIPFQMQGLARHNASHSTKAMDELTTLLLIC